MNNSIDKAQTALIIGAGPAGLTAAYELITRANIIPTVLEATDCIGGISTTKIYKGNRIDIGGHRFFSKSDRVMEWWSEFLPLQSLPFEEEIHYHSNSKSIKSERKSVDPEKIDKVMLVRSRLSRILYRGKFFFYPITLSVQTLINMGIIKTVKVGLTYFFIKIRPIKPEKTLEDFFINRFGKELYESFFKNYNYKVWGKYPNQMSPDWGAQRVKGVSIHKVLETAFIDMVSKILPVKQKKRETSLIQKFLYPKYGPGQMWETVADEIESKGGKVTKNVKVTNIIWDSERICSVEAENVLTGEKLTFSADYFFSTMPLKELVMGLQPPAPLDVLTVAKGLEYRDFITVGLLLKKFKNNEEIKDSWIYIHEENVKVGRVQIFNNWSPYLVSDQSKRWIGFEYFCQEGDEFWSLSDSQIEDIAKKEVARLNLANTEDVEDAVVIRMLKTYPTYAGTYTQLFKIRELLDKVKNLYLIGRNGMHRYNNQDHSMLTAMIAVDNILAGNNTRTNVWDVNTEEEYHEEKAS